MGESSISTCRIRRKKSCLAGSRFLVKKSAKLIKVLMYVGDCEFAVVHAVADPLEPHVNGFGSFLFDRISCNSDRARIITHKHCIVRRG